MVIPYGTESSNSYTLRLFLQRDKPQRNPKYDLVGSWKLPVLFDGKSTIETPTTRSYHEIKLSPLKLFLFLFSFKEELLFVI